MFENRMRAEEETVTDEYRNTQPDPVSVWKEQIRTLLPLIDSETFYDLLMEQQEQM